MASQGAHRVRNTRGGEKRSLRTPNQHPFLNEITEQGWSKRRASSSSSAYKPNTPSPEDSDLFVQVCARLQCSPYHHNSSKIRPQRTAHKLTIDLPNPSHRFRPRVTTELCDALLMLHPVPFFPYVSYPLSNFSNTAHTHTHRRRRCLSFLFNPQRPRLFLLLAGMSSSPRSQSPSNGVPPAPEFISLVDGLPPSTSRVNAFLLNSAPPSGPSLANSASIIFRLISPFLPPTQAPALLRAVSESFADAQSRLSSSEASRDAALLRLRQSESLRASDSSLSSTRQKQHADSLSDARKQRDEALKEVSRLHGVVQTMKVRYELTAAAGRHFGGQPEAATARDNIDSYLLPPDDDEGGGNGNGNGNGESSTANANGRASLSAFRRSIRQSLQAEFEAYKSLLSTRWDEALSACASRLSAQRDEAIRLAADGARAEARLKYAQDYGAAVEGIEAAARREVGDLTKLCLRMHETCERRGETVDSLKAELEDIRRGTDRDRTVTSRRDEEVMRVAARRELDNQRLEDVLAQNQLRIEELEEQVKHWKSKSDGDWFQSRASLGQSQAAQQINPSSSSAIPTSTFGGSAPSPSISFRLGGASSRLPPSEAIRDVARLRHEAKGDERMSGEEDKVLRFRRPPSPDAPAGRSSIAPHPPPSSDLSFSAAANYGDQPFNRHDLSKSYMASSRDVYSSPLQASFADTSFAQRGYSSAYATGPADTSSADEPPYHEASSRLAGVGGGGSSSRDPSPPPPSRTALPQTEAVTERMHRPTLGHAGGLTPRGDDKAKLKGAHPRLDKFLQGF